MKMTTEFRQAAIRNGFVATTRKTEKTVPAAENLRYAASLEMANLGFRLSPDALEGMSTTALTNMIADARVVIGADRNMTPIYPGFPKQVQELNTMTLFWEQILHYWTAGEFLPNYSEIERDALPLEDMVRATRTLAVRPAAEVASHLVTSLTQSMVALSEGDKELLAGAVNMAAPTVDDVREVLAGSRHGENMATLVSIVFNRSLAKVSADELVIALAPTAKNPDQLLRLVLTTTASISGDDENSRHLAGFDRAVNHLSDKDYRAVRVATLSRPARRALLTRLGQLTDGFYADALVSRNNLWRRVMKMAHPYSVNVNASVADATKRALDIIHGNVEYRTFNYLVEDALARKDAAEAVRLLSENQPGNLLRRLVSLVRITTEDSEISALVEAVRVHGAKSTVSTLVSAYNGVLDINGSAPKLTRVAGQNNALIESKEREPVHPKVVGALTSAIDDAIVELLKAKKAPSAPVGVVSDAPVPLVRRDASTTDRVMDRGERLAPVGDGDTVRIFGHWRNNQNRSGYMDIGAVVFDKDFNKLDVITWNTWANGRAWSTYSGDKNVSPGGEAAEYVDVNVPGLRKAHPKARWVAMTIQSWSGFPTKDVDMIAGVMLRSEPNSGEVFDARTVSTAFKPTTASMQSVPLVFDVISGEMVWIDSSSGSTATSVSAEQDEAVGTVVYNEIARPRMTLGELAERYAEAHGVKTVNAPVDRDTIVGLLG